MTQEPAETAATPQVPIPHEDGQQDFGRSGTVEPESLEPESGEPDSGGPDSGEPESVKQVFVRLYADGRAYARAEADRQKLRFGLVAAGVRDAAIFAVVALMLVFAGIVAFLIGLVFALTPILGPLWASLAVLASALIVAFGLLLIAKARIGRMMEAIAP